MSSNALTSGNARLDSKIREWLMWDRNIKTSNQVKKMIKNGEYERLNEMLMTRMKFTIDGLRGKMGPGYGAINDLLIVQTGQGILKYLEDADGRGLKGKGIVIGYDARYNSKRFAELIATIFIQKNYPVKLFNNVIPTSFVPFAVARYNSVLGIMITASSNPKNENGMKVYGPHGAQIISNVDEQIEACITESFEPLSSSWDTSILTRTDMRTNPLSDILRAYLDMIHVDICEEFRNINKKSNMTFVYTPLHGTGFIYFARVMEIVGLKLIPVEEQKYPNPDFPTVRELNFTDGTAALAMAEETAHKANSTVVIANNPDCVRILVAEKSPTSSEFKILSDDELATLLGWWAFHCHQKGLGTDEKPTNVFMIGNIFNTKILKAMAKVEGFHFVETLNGFRWIGSTAKDLINKGHKVIFGYEGNGFMFNTNVLDKDGIQASVHLASLVAYLNHHGITLYEHLEEIFNQYGFHTSIKQYYKSEDSETIDIIFNTLRNFEGPDSYPRSMLNGKYPIKFIRDFQAGLDTAETENKTTLPHDPNIELITFTFQNGMIASVYANKVESNTIRLYTEICGGHAGHLGNHEIRGILNKMILSFIDEFLQPEQNQLVLIAVPGSKAIHNMNSGKFTKFAQSSEPQFT